MNRHKNQWNIIESPNIDMYKFRNKVYVKDGISYKGIKIGLSEKMVLQQIESSIEKITWICT